MVRFEKLKYHYRIKKSFVKVKFADFVTTTFESAQQPLPNIQNYQTLIRMGWERRKLPVRLLGLGVSLSIQEEIQLTLF